MSVAINLEKGTCTIAANGTLNEVPINRVSITTDENLRASVIRFDAWNAMLTEEEVETLLVAGAKDNRVNLAHDE